ncbi:TonB family domain-containing protein [uncultured Paludibacter sp.]|uniref:TonB family domain-containing protein n=1 Tax=uncultured Paludibacter sp. TaxID=497635 RepID=A0A653AEG9_9BACT|nr:TonB family domain-containing protein [uncultured Paludibacter sp.]
MANDVNLNSNAWTDIIFKDKNKEYGAYTLRRTSSARHRNAFIWVGAFAIVAFLLPMAFQALHIGQAKEDVGAVEMSNIKLDKPEVKKEDQVKKFEAPPPPELKSTIKFTAPVIKKDEEVPESDIKSQEELTESKVTISVADVKGTNEETGVDIKTLQENKVVVAEEPEEKIFEVVEVPPSFPGGEAELMKYLHDNIKYPVVAQENNIQGKVVVQFVVGRDGSIQDVQVVRGVDPSLDREAKRVVQSMPKWIPGKQGGSAVKCKFFVPVNFKLQ